MIDVYLRGKLAVVKITIKVSMAEEIQYAMI